MSLPALILNAFGTCVKSTLGNFSHSFTVSKHLEDSSSTTTTNSPASFNDKFFSVKVCVQPDDIVFILENRKKIQNFTETIFSFQNIFTFHRNH